MRSAIAVGTTGTSTKKLREHARAAGADEVASNPPAFSELQVLLVRALGRPMSVK